MDQGKTNSDVPKNSWSIKGVTPNNRNTARQIAGRYGLTIGEFINNLIANAENKSDSPNVSDNYGLSEGNAEKRDERHIMSQPETSQYSDNLARALDALSRKLDEVTSPQAYAPSQYSTNIKEDVSRDNLKQERAIDALSRKLEDSEDRLLRKTDRLNNAIEDLKDTQSAINEKLRTAEKSGGSREVINSLLKLEDSLAGLVRRINENRDRTENLEKRLDESPQKHLTPADVERILEGSVNSIHSSLEKQFGKFNERLINAEELAGKSENLDGRITLLDGKVKIIEEYSKNNSETVRQALLEVSERLAKVESGVEDFSKENLEKSLAELAARINNIENGISGFYDRVKTGLDKQLQSFLKNINEKVSENEKSSRLAIANLTGQIIKASKDFDTRIGIIEKFNNDYKDSGLAMRMEIGKLGKFFENSINEVKKSNFSSVSNVELRLNQLSENVNTHIKELEESNQYLEQKIKNHAISIVDQRIEESHKDIYDLVVKNNQEAERKLNDKIKGFDARLNIAQENSKSIAQPIRETLAELLVRLESMERKKTLPSEKSSDKKSNEITRDFPDYYDDIELDDDDFDNIAIPSSHIEAATKKEDNSKSDDKNWQSKVSTLGIPAENIINNNDIYAQEYNRANGRNVITNNNEENSFDLDFGTDNDLNFLDDNIGEEAFLPHDIDENSTDYDDIVADDAFENEFDIESPKPDHKKKTYVFDDDISQDDARNNDIYAADEDSLKETNSDNDIEDELSTGVDNSENSKSSWFSHLFGKKII